MSILCNYRIFMNLYLEITFESFIWTFLGPRGDPGPDGVLQYGPEGLPGIAGPPGQIGNTQIQTQAASQTIKSTFLRFLTLPLHFSCMWFTTTIELLCPITVYRCLWPRWSQRYPGCPRPVWRPRSQRSSRLSITSRTGHYWAPRGPR